MFTDDYKLAFCQATNSLPTDVQKIIWEENKKIDFCPPTPQAPMKKRVRVASKTLKMSLAF